MESEAEKKQIVINELLHRIQALDSETRSLGREREKLRTQAEAQARRVRELEDITQRALADRQIALDLASSFRICLRNFAETALDDSYRQIVRQVLERTSPTGSLGIYDPANRLIDYKDDVPLENSSGDEDY